MVRRRYDPLERSRDSAPPNRRLLRLFKTARFKVRPRGRKIPGAARFQLRWTIPKIHYKNDPVKMANFDPDELEKFKLHFMDLFRRRKRMKGENKNLKLGELDYLEPFLSRYYPCLDGYKPESYHYRVQRRHVKFQKFLTNLEAFELMLAAHHHFKIDTLLQDMRHAAEDYSRRELAQGNEDPIIERFNPPGSGFTMYAKDVRRLIRDLLGRKFHPKIHVTKIDPKSPYYHLYELTIFVDQNLAPVMCAKGSPSRKYTCDFMDIVRF